MTPRFRRGARSTAVCLLAAVFTAGAQGAPAWTTEFGVQKSELRSTGRNPYFVLEPGHSFVLAGGDERLTITVLKETRVVDGVETRIVEERETKGGALVEISRNYFAISARTSSVFYFGEDVDMYKGGKVVSHEGSWLSGVNGAKFGMMMPGTQRLGERYHQEVAPGLAMDRAETVGLSETVAGGGGPWKNCLRVEETSPLEPAVKEYKYYAPGVGLVREGELRRVTRQ